MELAITDCGPRSDASAVEAMNDNEGLIEIVVGQDMWTRRNKPPYVFSVEDVLDPYVWLKTERGEAIMKRIAEGHYYSGYEPSQQGYGLKDATKIADRMLDAIAKGDHPMTAIDEDHRCYQSPQSYLFHVEDDRDALITALVEECDERGIEFDEDAWREAIEDDLVERLMDADESSPANMLNSYDLAEIAFDFCHGFTYAEDAMISSTKNYARFDALCVDQALQVNLSPLGYSIADYRKISGNRLKGETLRRGLRKRKTPLVTPDQLQSLVSNACSSYFQLSIYAMVRLTDILAIDPKKPMTFENATICSYNRSSGTFHEETKVANVTVVPREGRLNAITGYTPSDVCGGLSARYYESRLTNA